MTHTRKTVKYNIVEIPKSKIMSSYFLRKANWITSSPTWQLYVAFSNILFFFFFCFLMAAPAAYGGSQAGGQFEL